MAKAKDPFDKFREATLGQKSSALTDALSSPKTQASSAVQKIDSTPLPQPSSKVSSVSDVNSSALEKISKNANRELVSFHISKETKKKLNLLKVELEKSLGDLYNEAIEDLLAKYNR